MLTVLIISCMQLGHFQKGGHLSSKKVTIRIFIKNILWQFRVRVDSFYYDFFQSGEKNKNYFTLQIYLGLSDTSLRVTYKKLSSSFLEFCGGNMYSLNCIVFCIFHPEFMLNTFVINSFYVTYYWILGWKLQNTLIWLIQNSKEGGWTTFNMLL